MRSRRGHVVQVYWVKFERLAEPTPLNFGAGVTGYDEADVRLQTLQAFGPLPVASIATVQSLDDLEQGHVRPNMGFHLRRGVWFPLGFDTPT